MIGDKLVITDYHRQGAKQAMETLKDKLASASSVLAVSVAGESGSGKSEIAFCLKELLEAQGKKAVILGQDDYFKLPPKSNHNKRLEDISWVGPGEVKLDLLDENIAAIKSNPAQELTKPLVYFDEDRIDSETIQPDNPAVVIAEGTYTSLLNNLDMRVFINRNYRQTKKARLKRARDPDVDFLEKVLQIEHQEISKHKARADVVLAPPPEERE
jgi:uridine kinase